MNKVALFDFCETIANFQTADAFIDYVRSITRRRSMINKEKIRLFLKRTYILKVLGRIYPRYSLNKRLILWQLRGFTEHELEQYAQTYYEVKIKPNLISDVVKELINHQNNGWRVLIVSAGYEIYLKYFCLDFNIPLEDLIAVKIKFKRDLCLGCFDGGDRLWDKIDKLNERFDRSSLISIAYSDSPTDLPLLKWAKEAVVVRRTDKISWSNNLNFKEIVWSK